MLSQLKHTANHRGLRSGGCLIRLCDGAVIDDISLTGAYSVDETIRRVGQLG